MRRRRFSAFVVSPAAESVSPAPAPVRSSLATLLGVASAMLLGALVLVPGSLDGQRARQPSAIGPRPATMASTTRMVASPTLPGASGAAGKVNVERQREGQWWLPAASAVVPGSAQLLMRQQRGVAYLAVEGFLLFQYATYRRDAREQRDTYREIARTQARARFGGSEPVSDFEYYETLRDTRFIESGRYDVAPGGDLDPETADGTFNGFIWTLARQTYFRDPDATPDRASPEYASAIALYERRAVRDDQRWSWRDAQVFRDEYTNTIRRSNAAYRSAATYLSAVIANHALSTVDAFVTVRVRSAADGGSQLGFDASLPWAPFGRPDSRARAR